MSKRYGRTQKRKHRERIADLERLHWLDRKAISNLDQNREKWVSKYGELVREIKKWWEYSVLLDPKIEEVDMRELPPFYEMDGMPAEMMATYATGTDPTQEYEIHIQTLEALKVAAYYDLGDRTTHVRLSVGDKQVGYYIDPKAFEIFGGIPTKMAREVLFYLTREFGRSYGNRKSSREIPQGRN